MKILIFLILTVPAIAQVDICRSAENSLDPVTGQRIVQSEFYRVGKNARNNIFLLASVRRIDSLYYLYIVSQLPGCAGETTSVTFTTTAGQTIKRGHLGEVNCGETEWVIYGIPYNSTGVIKILVDEEAIRKHGLSQIRLTSSENYTDINLSMPFNLRTVFDCVDQTFMGKAKGKPKRGINNQ